MHCSASADRPRRRCERSWSLRSLGVSRDGLAKILRPRHRAQVLKRSQDQELFESRPFTTICTDYSVTQFQRATPNISHCEMEIYCFAEFRWRKEGRIELNCWGSEPSFVNDFGPWFGDMRPPVFHHTIQEFEVAREEDDASRITVTEANQSLRYKFFSTIQFFWTIDFRGRQHL